MRNFLERHPVAVLSAVTLAVTAFFVVLGGVAGNGSPLVRVGLVAAFLGGVLSLLSPCSAALLPAFFAVSFRERRELVRMTAIFWLGLATVFVPLGFAGTALSRAFAGNRQAFFVAAGVFFLVYGLFTLLTPLLRGGSGGARLRSFGKGPLGVYLTGVFFSFSAGTCAAPVIGAIFTLAAASSAAAYAFVLLFVYSLGLVAPLFFLAWFFEWKGVMRHPLVQGRLFTWRLGGRPVAVHSTEIATGVLFLAISGLFFFAHGTYGLATVFTRFGITDLYFRLNTDLLTGCAIAFLGRGATC